MSESPYKDLYQNAQFPTGAPNGRSYLDALSNPSAKAVEAEEKSDELADETAFKGESTTLDNLQKNTDRLKDEWDSQGIYRPDPA